MSTKGLIAKVAAPAIVGATVAYIMNKMGYNLSAVEGAKQTLLASMPATIYFFSTESRKHEKTSTPSDSIPNNHPYLIPLLTSATFAAIYFAGSYGMEWLSGKEINQPLVSISGGIEGIIAGIVLVCSASGSSNIRHEKR